MIISLHPLLKRRNGERRLCFPHHCVGVDVEKRAISDGDKIFRQSVLVDLLLNGRLDLGKPYLKLRRRAIDCRAVRQDKTGNL